MTVTNGGLRHLSDALGRDAIRPILAAVATGPVRVQAEQPISGSFQDSEERYAYASVADLGGFLESHCKSLNYFIVHDRVHLIAFDRMAQPHGRNLTGGDQSFPPPSRTGCRAAEVAFISE
jgi:hypothetical protein